MAYHVGMITEQFASTGEPDAPTGRPGHDRIAIHDGPVHTVTAELRTALAPATTVLHEWHEYRVTCEGASWLEVGSDWITEYGFGSGTFRVQFANQIGLAQLRAIDTLGATLDIRHVEVVSPKLGGADTSLAFLRAVLADLTSERGALAYLPRAQTSRTVQHVQRPPSLLIQYFFLLNTAEDIAEALQHIRQNPHRVLDDEAEHVSILDVTEIDPDVVLQIAQGGAEFDRSTTPPRLRAAPGGVWFRMP